MTEPEAEPTFDMVAAALRADSADVATYAQVFTESLGDVLPPGCVTVERERTMADRMRGRPGQRRRRRPWSRTLARTPAPRRRCVGWSQEAEEDGDMSRETAHAYRTALVTGASSGIGASIARLLAAAGTDLVVVARRAERLAEKAAQLRGEHKIAVETLQADLTKPDELAAVEARLADPARPVELLVNNAGAGAAGEFERLSVDSAESLIRLNVLALVRLTHAGLPGMLARRHGGILNVSSMAGFAPSPRVSTYAATKALVTLFSESLHVELRPRGHHI